MFLGICLMLWTSERRKAEVQVNKQPEEEEARKKQAAQSKKTKSEAEKESPTQAVIAEQRKLEEKSGRKRLIDMAKKQANKANHGKAKF